MAAFKENSVPVLDTDASATSFITHDQAEARQLASAISRAGIEKSDVVSVMVPNVPLGVTCHFAVPGMGATLHMINTRLDAKTVAFQVKYSTYGHHV